ncbi:transglutaminase-like domain-containing protein [Clostridium aestuarii]|uniref:Transglutaminase-like domain-containing protein n=1 Tax=Clostridium aestuarii TaxID=338193 RepID=A0ABT4CWI1_9CLOT|nr:transglutaminase-like domain-containing protein [Clostridium aestuarii]MCY6483351.1 transglutaminase-like domain-containing protein [Clostridium aestuarii]
MLKKIIASLSIILSVTLVPCSRVFAQEISTNIFDNTSINKGLISVNYSPDTDIKAKLLIEKDNAKYFYDLKNDKNESFPLQLGSGEYNIKILKQKDGQKYTVAEKQSINADIDNKREVYLNAIQTINWNKEMEPIKKAKELTNKAVNDREKVEAVYDYIVKNIKYDYDKINKISNDYVPNINDTFKTSKGICYDYSSLLASMLRSVGVPTKLVKGYKNDIDTYHAWNEVYLKDSDTWVTIDTTYDAYLLSENKEYSMIKDASQYSKVKEY